MASSSSVAVVGGGISGLTAAIDLARGGVAVELFEASAEAGGRARTRVQEGFCFNQGAHALYLRGAFRRTLKRLGVAIPGGAPDLAGAQGVDDGRLKRLPTSFGALLGTSLFSLAEKLQFARVQTAIARGATGAGSLAHWLDAQHLRPRVRTAFEAVVRLTAYAHAPARLSAAVVLDQVRLGLAGVIYVDGGWSTLIDGLLAVAREAGVVIHAGAAVAEARSEEAGVTLRLVDGAVRTFSAAILALPPRDVAALAPGVSSIARAAIEALPQRVTALDLGLDALPSGAAMFALGIDRPLYFSVHSTAGRLAPRGGALVHIARYLDPDETVAPDAIAELESYADLCMPRWRAHERTRRRLIDMPVAHGLPRWDVPRPGPALADAPRLFIAGDWVGPEGMLSDAAAASGAAARLILQRAVGDHASLRAA